MSTTGGVQGIDVSKWQSKTPSLAGLDFLIARASIGTLRDEMYATHIRNAKRAGLVTGAYHFNHDGVSIAAQVRTFLDAAGDVDLYALDVEGRDAFSRAQAGEFIDRVLAKRPNCGLYMSESQFFNAGQSWDWVANWSQPPSRRWHIWQYQGSPLDRNRFNGTLAELAAFAGRDTQSEETPVTISVGDGINVGIEEWTLDGKTRVIAIGGPRTADGDTASDLRLVLVGDGTTSDDANFVARSRLTNPKARPDLTAFVRQVLAAGAIPTTGPTPEELQAIVNAAIVEAIEADRAKATIKVVYE